MHMYFAHTAGWHKELDEVGKVAQVSCNVTFFDVLSLGVHDVVPSTEPWMFRHFKRTFRHFTCRSNWTVDQHSFFFQKTRSVYHVYV